MTQKDIKDNIAFHPAIEIDKSSHATKLHFAVGVEDSFTMSSSGVSPIRLSEPHELKPEKIFFSTPT